MQTCSRIHRNILTRSSTVSFCGQDVERQKPFQFVHPGLLTPVETTDLWPRAKKRTQPDGAPEEGSLKWPKENKYVMVQGSDKDYLREKLCEKLDNELQLGRLEIVHEPNVKVVTKVTPIFKDDSKTEIRAIEDYRRSGINGCIQCDRTISLSSLDDVTKVVGSAQEKTFLLQLDCKAAYRQLAVREEEQEFLVIRHPVTNNYLKQKALPWISNFRIPVGRGIWGGPSNH
jgi:hypothetical protein